MSDRAAVALTYYSHLGGPTATRWHQCFGPLQVLRSADDPEAVGRAHPWGPSPCGLGLFRLEVDGEVLEGLYYCVNRVFVRYDTAVAKSSSV